MKVSVIVPMYNVERYIEACIDSVLQQSYQDLELILVDDGSPDKSGEIAESFSLLDKRVLVVHQKNSGVSAARNAGVEVCVGDYITFIDGDDCISRDFVEHMLTLATKHQAELVISTKVLRNIPIEIQEQHEAVATWSAADATASLLYPEIPLGCWNKLYSRSLFQREKLRFLSEYYMGEGLNFIVQAAQRSRKTVATNRAMYYYRRDNSESATTRLTVPKMQNALAAIDNIKSGLLENSRAVEIALIHHQWMTRLYSLHFLNATGQQQEHQDFYGECLKYVKNWAPKLLVQAEVSAKERLKLFLSLFSLSLLFKLIK